MTDQTAPTIRRFRVSEGFDLSCELSIDTTKLTEEVAHQMVDFWTGGEDVLEASDGDFIMAAARLAGAAFIRIGMEGYNVQGCQKQLDEAEGYPGPDSGIVLLDLEIPDVQAECVEVEEIK